jgi:hypothetical protein
VAVVPSLGDPNAGDPVENANTRMNVPGDTHAHDGRNVLPMM